MAKQKIYRAERTSSFMPFDQGNKWVVTAPNGNIIHNWCGHNEGLKQNEAIRLAKGLNDGSIDPADYDNFKNYRLTPKPESSKFIL